MSPQQTEDLLQQLAFDERGLVPVITQDGEDGCVLMLAYANEEALRLTLTSGRAHYFSRSRQELWRKGDSSGNIQQVIDVALDCDGDAVLYRVRQSGPACHTGERSCFHRSCATNVPDAATAEAAPARQVGESQAGVEYGTRLGAGLALLERVVAQRLRELPEGSYVTRLHERGRGYIAQKVVEEAGETIVAALEGRDDELTGEAADLLFHLSVLLRESGQSMGDVVALLERRHNSRSGA